MAINVQTLDNVDSVKSSDVLLLMRPTSDGSSYGLYKVRGDNFKGDPGEVESVSMRRNRLIVNMTE